MDILVLFIASLTLLILFVLFTAWETMRGRRVAGNVRARMDHSLEAYAMRGRNQLSLFSISFVQTLHFVLHNIIAALLRVLRWLEGRLQGLLRMHKALVTKKGGKSSDYMSQVVQHKKETALPEDEKQRRKDEALESDVRL